MSEFKVKSAAHNLRSTFMRGVQFALPLAIFYVILKTVLSFVDSWLGNNSATLAHWIFPHAWLIGPCGKLLGAIVIGGILLLVGVLALTAPGRKLLGYVDWAVSRVPVFGGIYRALRKMMNVVTVPGTTKGGTEHFKMGVLVDSNGHGQWHWGLVISETYIDDVHHLVVMTPNPPNPTGGAIKYVPDGQWKLLNEVSTSSETMEVLMSYGLVTPPRMTSNRARMEELKQS